LIHSLISPPNPAGSVPTGSLVGEVFLSARVFRGWLVVYRFRWLLPNFTKENNASGLDLAVGQGRRFFVSNLGFLHQATIKFYRLSIVCHDQYAELAFVVVVWSSFVGFAFLSTR
jgi:hypothetical protein